MRTPRKVLFIQHAGEMSGSAMSLLYTVRHLDRSKFLPIIGLVKPSPFMHRIYRSENVEMVSMEGIVTYEHTTGRAYGYWNPWDLWMRFSQRRVIKRGIDATRRYISNIRPDLVHLNSVTLIPTAIALARDRIPFVWHVREHPVRGLWGQRLRFIQRMLLSLPFEIIFISETDRKAWIGDSQRGVVVPNYVDMKQFHRDIDVDSARRRFGLPSDASVVLFLGGISVIKGTIPFIRAMRLVRQRFPEACALMPIGSFSSNIGPFVRAVRYILPKIGSGTYQQRASRLMNSSDLKGAFIVVEPTPEVTSLFAVCDVLAFPHTVPHFGRPIIEAAAMCKPSVSSDLPGMRDVVEHEITGLLVPPNDPVALADALCRILGCPHFGAELGTRAFQRAANRHSLETAMQTLHTLYDRVLQN